MNVTKEQFTAEILARLATRKLEKVQAEKLIISKEADEYWSYAHVRKNRGKILTQRNFQC